MTDMLVKLYELKHDWGFLSEQAARGIVIRKPIGPEHRLLTDWVGNNFNSQWGSEADVACARCPTACFIAQFDQSLIGFGCYDATALGFFGPSGVLESYRGQGAGRALLLACLLDMQLKGYGYAVIGGVGPAEFYKNVAGAVEIPGSSPGIYRSLLRQGQ